LATALLLNIEYLDICSIGISNIYILYIYQIYPYICVHAMEIDTTEITWDTAIQSHYQLSLNSWSPKYNGRPHIELQDT